MRRRGGAALVAMTLAAACDSTGPAAVNCTEIGCIDGVFIVLRPRDGTWDPGSYRLELDFDDASHSCALTVPDDLPPTAGTPVQLRCEPQLEASLSAEVTCTEQRTSGGSSQSCTPLAGRFRLDVRRDGTPELLRIQIERDAAAVFAHDQQLEYEESRPNGPDCEPLCRQAELDLFF